MAHVTTMVLKVDLQCHECYKKVKKVLCSFSQIQDQVYDEKQNTVTIKVVCCCDPEKMKQKILCKGKDVIKCIKIKVPPPPPPPPRLTPPPPPPPPLPPPPPPPLVKLVPVPCVPCVPCVPVCPVPGAGPFRRTCCRECNEGRVGGPCFDGYENNCGPVPSSSPCDCYWRRLVVCDSYGGGNFYFHPPQEQCSDPDAGCQIM